MAVEAAADPKQTQLYKIRHSLAHIMAQAVLEIRPAAKLGFGPPVDFGFYYDFDFGDAPITDADLADIEDRMKKIVKERQPFQQAFKSLAEAPNQKFVMLPMESSGILGSLAGITELAKEALNHQQTGGKPPSLPRGG